MGTPGKPDIGELYTGQLSPEQAALETRREVVDEAVGALMMATAPYEPAVAPAPETYSSDRVANVNLGSMVNMHQGDFDLAA